MIYFDVMLSDGKQFAKIRLDCVSTPPKCIEIEELHFCLIDDPYLHYVESEYWEVKGDEIIDGPTYD